MSLRKVLNVAWMLACEGLDEEGVDKLHAWLNSTPTNPARNEQEERKRKALENQAGFATLAQAFATGK